MNENNDSSSNSIAILLFICILGIILPFIINEYIKEYYVYAWYWVSYAKFTFLYKITEYNIVRENLEYIIFWTDWFLVDSKIPDGQLFPLINQTYSTLIDVDMSNPQTIKNSFIYNDSMNSSFQSIGRLSIAIYFPIYLACVLFLSYKLITVDFYNTVFTLDSFSETMAEGFPELLPVVYANPLNQDINKGVWRMSPKIYAYLKDKNCIIEYIDNGKEMFRLHEDNLASLLVEQLGDRWQGFENLNLNQRTLVALALPMVNSPAKGKKATYELIEALGYTYSSKPTFLKCLVQALKTTPQLANPIIYLNTKKGKSIRSKVIKNLHWILIGYKESIRQHKYRKISLKMINKIIEKNKNNEDVQKILKSHAYNSTVIAALIERARLGGVLPSCSCIWLKVEDRNLFYIFNNLGRYVSWVEVVGFWSHYSNEKNIKAPYPYPKIESGVEGIDEALYSSFYNYTPIFDRE